MLKESPIRFGLSPLQMAMKIAYKWGVYLLTTYNHKPTTSPIRTHLWKIILSLSNSLSLGRGGFGLADFETEVTDPSKAWRKTFGNQNRVYSPETIWRVQLLILRVRWFGGKVKAVFCSMLCFVFCCVGFFHPRNYRRNVLNVAWNKTFKVSKHSRKKKQLWLIISKRNDSSLPLFKPKTVVLVIPREISLLGFSFTSSGDVARRATRNPLNPWCPLQVFWNTMISMVWMQLMKPPVRCFSTWNILWELFSWEKWVC